MKKICRLGSFYFIFMDLFCFGPPSVFMFRPSVIHYMLLYSTLPCNKIARAPGGIKEFCSLSWGGGGTELILFYLFKITYITCFQQNAFEWLDSTYYKLLKRLSEPSKFTNFWSLFPI